MVLAIDFDGVICGTERKPGFKMPEPVTGAVDYLQRLKRAGHTIIIHTVRGDRPEHVAQWLRHFEVPYDSITNIKPEAGAYLDDRGVRFRSWALLPTDPERWGDR